MRQPSQNVLRAIALTGLLFVIFLLVLPQAKPAPGLWSKALWNLLHIPAFFVITVMFAVLLADRYSGLKKTLLLVLIGSIIAVGSEWIQQMTGRSASVQDLVLDGVGIAFALAFWHGKNRWGWGGWSLYLASLVGVLLVSLWPTIEISRAIERNRVRLPDISVRSHSDDLLLWRAQGNAEVSSAENGSALKIGIGPGKYGGVSYQPGLQDWSVYEELVLSVRNGGESFAIGVRVDDENSKTGDQSTWYATESIVPVGRNEIRISLDSVRNELGGSPIDLSRVVRLALFTGKESTGREFVINSAFLR